MWPVNPHKTENVIWHWYLENGKHFQAGSRGVDLRIVGSKKISQPVVFWLHEDETQPDPQGSVGRGKRWEMCEWTRSSGHAGRIEQVTSRFLQTRPRSTRVQKAHVSLIPLPPFISPQKKHKDRIKYVRGCLSRLSVHFIVIYGSYWKQKLPLSHCGGSASFFLVISWKWGV